MILYYEKGIVGWNMKDRIKILDCTLRDGGHVVDGKFGKAVITNVIKKLTESDIDIVEVVFLCDEKNDEDVARFRSIEDVKKYCQNKRQKPFFH